MKSESIVIAKSELELTLDDEIKEGLVQFNQLYESLEDYRRQILKNEKNESSMNRMVVFEMIDENQEQSLKLAKKIKFLVDFDNSRLNNWSWKLLLILPLIRPLRSRPRYIGRKSKHLNSIIQRRRKKWNRSNTQVLTGRNMSEKGKSEIV